MMVLALALHLDPVYVGAHHLARFLVVTLAIAIAARRIAIKDTLARTRAVSASPERAGSAQLKRADEGST
jgi:hypothetical protein